MSKKGVKTKESEWHKNCPNCNDDMYYGRKYELKRSIKNKTICSSCSSKINSNACKGVDHYNYGNERSDGVKEKISKSKKGVSYIDLHGEEEAKKIKKKISDTLTGRVIPDEVIEKIRKGNTGKKHSKETKEKLSEINSGENHPHYGLKGELCHNHGRVVSKETRKKISDWQKENAPSRGRKHTEESKKIMREKAIKRLEGIDFKRGTLTPNFNKKACDFFDYLNENMGLDGHHAKNNGEYTTENLRYFFDYYEEKLNLVIEWDEPKHYTIDGDLKKEDMNRQEEIMNHLNCNFYRINEMDYDDLNFEDILNDIKKYAKQKGII